MSSQTVSQYILPKQWIRYDIEAVAGPLVEAKTAAQVLSRLPYLPQWIAEAHREQLRLEAVGTTRIEGAQFTPRELEEALTVPDDAWAGLTHSQRQLRAASDTYTWMREQPADRPVTADLILGIHRRVVTGCDDDHCEPGALRRPDNNVTFGDPRCRGAEGGDTVATAFEQLCGAIASEFQRHDRIVQAIALHYHLGAMHPFGDGNGRTARALEAFMLREAGVNEMVMVSLSNYYYEHQPEYLSALYESRMRGHDLTPILAFALQAIADRCNALADRITEQSKRILFREFAQALFGRLMNPRKRVLAERQVRILNTLLDSGPLDPEELVDELLPHYEGLKHPARALERDINWLIESGSMVVRERQFLVNLEWPRQVFESEHSEILERLPLAASSNDPDAVELGRLLGRRRRRGGRDRNTQQD